MPCHLVPFTPKGPLAKTLPPPPASAYIMPHHHHHQNFCQRHKIRPLAGKPQIKDDKDSGDTHVTQSWAQTARSPSLIHILGDIRFARTTQVSEFEYFPENPQNLPLLFWFTQSSCIQVFRYSFHFHFVKNSSSSSSSFYLNSPLLVSKCHTNQIVERKMRPKEEKERRSAEGRHYFFAAPLFHLFFTSFSPLPACCRCPNIHTTKQIVQMCPCHANYFHHNKFNEWMKNKRRMWKTSVIGFSSAQLPAVTNPPNWHNTAQYTLLQFNWNLPSVPPNVKATLLWCIYDTRCSANVTVWHIDTVT